MTTSIAMALLALVALCNSSATAVDWYVSVKGTPDGRGTQDAPWDIESALGGGKKIAAGDTIWLLAGTYKHPNRQAGNHGYAVRLVGQPEMPIHVRGVPGQRVAIDGGLVVMEPSSYLWIWDLEILVSENLTKSRRFEEPGSHPKSYDRPHGGLNIYTGAGCKYINLLIHDNAQGISFWNGATDSEIHGCIIYNNGWDAPDRGHGHAIYTQNENGIKTISDCIMTGGYSYTMHAYGSSRAFVDHYLVEGNVCYDAGPFLIGGGRPSRGIKVVNNYLHNVSMRIGYSAPHNEDCELRDNVIVNGELSIHNYRQVIDAGNLVLRAADPRPDNSPLIRLRPNRYQPMRSHLIIWNWQRHPQIAVDLSGRLKKGDRFQLLDPQDLFGSPRLAGVYDGKPVAVPVQDEFATFVLVSGELASE